MKKNKVFVNKIAKKLGNNQSYFDIKDNNDDYIYVEDKMQNSIVEEKVQNNNMTVKEKIDKLLNRNGYVFNVDVKIITYNKEYNTKIAGKVNNHLITLDNDIINISDIKDLIIKN